MTHDEMRALVREFYTSPLSFLEVDDGSTHVKMRKPTVGDEKGARELAADTASRHADPAVQLEAGAEPPDAPSRASVPVASELASVTAPVVGIYYEADAPGNAPLARVGAHVQAGQVVCLIEAMKTFNEIHAPVSGTVRTIHASDGAVVGFGDLLMEIEAD